MLQNKLYILNNLLKKFKQNELLNINNYIIKNDKFCPNYEVLIYVYKNYKFIISYYNIKIIKTFFLKKVYYCNFEYCKKLINNNDKIIKYLSTPYYNYYGIRKNENYKSIYYKKLNIYKFFFKKNTF